MMVGDRLETDIRMGNEAGMHTGVVLTGITRREDVPGSSVQPEFILENISDVLRLI